MAVNWDISPAFILTVIVNLVAVVAIVVRTEMKAASAHKEAEEASASAKEAHERIGIQSQALALYREQVAREYVSRDALGEMERRVTTSIDRLSDRLDKVLDRQGS